MHCSGCGKDVPFAGQVCPHCQRDKSSDQAIHVAATIGIFVGGTIGGWIGGFGGMIVGAIVVGFLVVIVGVASGSNSAKQPPKVRVDRDESSKPAGQTITAPKPKAADDPASRLARLDTLKADGIITPEEYQERRAAIIAAL